MLRPIIIGGGIGGLAMANALQWAGIPYAVYEQADALTEVGAGIGLSRGVLDLLGMLGLGDDVRANSLPIKRLYLADKNLSIRRQLPANYEGTAIHRATLVDILASRLPANRIHLGKRVREVQSLRAHALVRFEDDSALEADCLIAADGIHSAVRRSVFPDVSIRYIDQTIWRGITTSAEVPDWMREAYVEIWDEGLRYLTAPILTADGNRTEAVFWLAVKPAPPGEVDDPATVREELVGLFRNFHPVLQDLIRHSGSIIRNDMGDLGSPKRPWWHDRVVLIGDAIHATTPNLAQGGCQAIEDAVCLALCLRDAEADIPSAYERFQRLRQKKVSYVVNTSWRFGRGAHATNPLVHHLARAFLERAPAFFLQKQEQSLSDMDYLKSIADDAVPAPAA
jgi:2-polyprenyl-6-methoxyphenol hydroxylase-like FAD-dependent oxidoreductase